MVLFPAQVPAQESSKVLLQRWCDLKALQVNLIPKEHLGNASLFIGANVLRATFKEFAGKRLSLGEIFIEILSTDIEFYDGTSLLIVKAKTNGNIAFQLTASIRWELAESKDKPVLRARPVILHLQPETENKLLRQLTQQLLGPILEQITLIKIPLAKMVPVKIPTITEFRREKLGDGEVDLRYTLPQSKFQFRLDLVQLYPMNQGLFISADLKLVDSKPNLLQRRSVECSSKLFDAITLEKQIKLMEQEVRKELQHIQGNADRVELRLTENTLTTIVQVINQMPEKTRTVLINSVTRFGNLVNQDGNATNGPWTVALKDNSALNGHLQVVQIGFEGLHEQGAIFAFDLDGAVIAHVVADESRGEKPAIRRQGQGTLTTKAKLRGALTMQATKNKGLHWSLLPARKSHLPLSGKVQIKGLPEFELNETIRFNKPIATLVRDPVKETFPFNTPMKGWQGIIQLDFEKAHIDKKHQVFLSIRPQFKIAPLQ